MNHQKDIDALHERCNGFVTKSWFKWIVGLILSIAIGSISLSVTISSTAKKEFRSEVRDLKVEIMENAVSREEFGALKTDIEWIKNGIKELKEALK